MFIGALFVRAKTINNSSVSSAGDRINCSIFTQSDKTQ